MTCVASIASRRQAASAAPSRPLAPIRSSVWAASKSRVADRLPAAPFRTCAVSSICLGVRLVHRRLDGGQPPRTVVEEYGDDVVEQRAIVAEPLHELGAIDARLPPTVALPACGRAAWQPGRPPPPAPRRPAAGPGRSAWTGSRPSRQAGTARGRRAWRAPSSRRCGRDRRFGVRAPGSPPPPRSRPSRASARPSAPGRTPSARSPRAPGGRCSPP